MLANLFHRVSLFSSSDQRRTFEKRELQPIMLPYNSYSERLAAELSQRVGQQRCRIVVAGEERL